MINQLRGFLLEHGITVVTGPAHLKRQIPSILEDADNLLSPRMRTLLLELRDEWVKLEEQIDAVNRELAEVANKDDGCRRLLTIPGIGPLTATALTAAIGNGAAFRKSRDLAAWLGLVPRQHSTGGKARLLGISKRGNPYLRRLRSRWPGCPCSGEARTTPVWGLARPTRSPITAERRYRRDGQQDCAHGLGHTHQRPELSGQC